MRRIRSSQSLAVQCICFLAQHERLIIVPQNLYEFWAVATRTRGRPPIGQNGLGMNSGRAHHWLNFFKRRFMLLPDRTDIVESWQNLVTTHDIKGSKSHDARLVAAMLTYGIDRLLTFNVNHFKAFPITTIDATLL
jgi:predicted nucleic acid-binding protein